MKRLSLCLVLLTGCAAPRLRKELAYERRVNENLRHENQMEREAYLLLDGNYKALRGTFMDARKKIATVDPLKK